MADARPWLIERDPRELHDQIIDHDLVGKTEMQLLAILVIEVRRLRDQMAELTHNVRLSAGG